MPENEPAEVGNDERWEEFLDQYSGPTDEDIIQAEFLRWLRLHPLTDPK